MKTSTGIFLDADLNENGIGMEEALVYSPQLETWQPGIFRGPGRAT